MPLIWCAISGHGYGHAAQVVPVLHALARLVPDLRVILRTTVPASFFESRLTIPWRLSTAQVDIGCIQDGPLTIDVAGTWAAHHAFHQEWPEKVQAEAQAIRAAAPTLVLSDISHLAIAAGAVSGHPTIGLCSLSWDRVLEPFADPADTHHTSILRQIRDAYAHADCFLRVAPGLSADAFHKMVDIGPIAEPAKEDPVVLRKVFRLENSERLVLVGFGGITLRRFPFDAMEQMIGYRFLVDGSVPEGLSRTTSLAAVGLRFKQVLDSVDLVLTKPGYGTVVECVALGKPVVYVRRYNFADEQALVDYLHRYGRGAELPMADFLQGRWTEAFTQALHRPAPTAPPPPLSGAEEAARVLAHSC